jgi:flagellar hook-length control protein FliK
VRPIGEVSVQEQSETRLYAARRDSNLTAPAQETPQFDSRQNLKTAPQSVRDAVLAAAPSSEAQTAPAAASVSRAEAATGGFVFPASNAVKSADVPTPGEVDPELGLDVKAMPRAGQTSQAEPKSIGTVQQAMASHAATANTPKPTAPPQVAAFAPGEAQGVEEQPLSVRAEDMSKSSEFVQVVQQGSNQRRDVPLTSAMAQTTGTETWKAVTPVSTGQEIAPGLSDGTQDAVIEQAVSQTGEIRSSSTQTPTAPPQQPQQHARAEAANVMRQVSENLQKMSNGGVEIRLSPEELGSVRLQMAPSEHGMVVTIQADRPETLELMRRNIDQLAQDLAAAGYEGAEFSFGDDGQGTQTGGRGQMASAEPVIEEQDAEPRPQTTTDGLDIRV